MTNYYNACKISYIPRYSEKIVAGLDTFIYAITHTMSHDFKNLLSESYPGTSNENSHNSWLNIIAPTKHRRKWTELIPSMIKVLAGYLFGQC